MIKMALHLFGYDLRATLRNRQSQFFALAMPVLFLVIFASVFGGGQNTTAVAGGPISTPVYYVPGIIALGVIAACFGNLVASVTAQRERGVLKRRRAARRLQPAHHRAWVRRPGPADRGGLGSRGPSHRPPQLQLAAARALTHNSHPTTLTEGKTMATEVQTHTGRCPTHGPVQATRETPKMGFPYVIYTIRRAAAQRRPFRCPECGAAVQANGLAAA
jgi:hypothetical protein